MEWMHVFMWALVLFPGDPASYNPVDAPSWIYGAYDTYEACAVEKDRVERLRGGGVKMVWDGQWACVFELTWVQRGAHEPK